MAKLRDVCVINMGQSPDSSTYNEKGDGIPFFQGNADFGEVTPNARIWCTDPTKIAQKDDILISVRAPIGALNMANTACCIGRGLAALTPNKRLCSGKYLWYALSGKVTELNNKGTGSTFKAINKSVLAETEIPLLPLESQRHIAAVLDKVSALIAKRRQQLDKLDELVKSRFMEMFGDPQSNPHGYQYAKLSNIATYAGYREVQDAGIALMQAASSEYDSEDREEVIADIYMDLTRTTFLGESVSDVTGDLRDSLEALLEDLGYDVGYVPYYFKYRNFSSYLTSYLFLEIDALPILAFYLVMVVALVFTLIYLANRKGSVTVGQNGVTCQKKKGHAMQLLYRDIISVKTSGLGGLSIMGPSVKFSTLFLKNGPALRAAIMERKLALSQQQPAPVAPATPPQDAADELKKYKELLDSGVITQEEFDQKKKQLLGL